MFRPRPASRAIALLFLTAATTVLPAARAGSLAMPKPRVLFEVDGSIVAFAQDGDRVAWADESAPCARSVMLRRISGGAAVPLVSPRGTVCGDAGVEGTLHARMALAGTRALWAYDYASNQAFNYTLFSGRAGGRERRVGGMSYEGGIEGGGSAPWLDLAGDGRELVYLDGAGYRVTDRARLVRGTDGASSLALDQGRLAVARDVAAVEVGNGSPRWSPDGAAIAFVSWKKVGEGDSEDLSWNLFVVDADGANRHAVTRNPYLEEFAWSPDGRSLLVKHMSDDGPISVVSSRGGAVRKLTEGREASWSPDGRSVVFVNGGAIFVIPAQGGTRRRMGQGSSPRWSPDGRSVVFVNGGAIFVVPAQGGTPRRIARGWSPQWSPDGNAIAYESGARLYVADFGGGSQRRVGSLNASTFRWSPDGTRIAYVNQVGSELRVVGQDGADEIGLVSFARRSLTGELEWSADSVRIAYTKWRTDGNAYELDVVAASGGSARTIAVVSARGFFDPGRLAWSPGGSIVFVDAESGEIARVGGDGSGRRLLTKTPGASRQHYAVQVLRMPGGAIGSTFDVQPCSKSLGGGSRIIQLPQLFGLSGSRLAVGLGCPDARIERVEIRSLAGRILRRLTLTGEAHSESFSGHWLVFRVDKAIYGVDTNSGRRYLLARRELPILRLSLEGRRIAWVETGPGERSRILALTLPG